MDCSPPGSSVHEILQARILERVAIPFCRWSFPTQGSNSGLLLFRRILYCLSHQGRPLLQEIAPYWANCRDSLLTNKMQQFCCFINSVQFSRSVMSDSLRPYGLQHNRLPCPLQLLELVQTHVHQVGDAIQPSHPLSSPSPPAFNLSQNQVFSNESVLCIRWPKYCSFSFSMSPSNEYSGLISFSNLAA